jgi:hypothetical protein
MKMKFSLLKNYGFIHWPYSLVDSKLAELFKLYGKFVYP